MIAAYRIPLSRDYTITCNDCRSTLPDGTRGEKWPISQRLLNRTQNFSFKILGLPEFFLALIFLVLGFSWAFAEDVKPPEYVPIVVDRVQFKAAMDYLGGLKFNDAAPMVKWLNELEDRAKGQWQADNGKEGK
jgi:hypothetical protein